MQQYLPFTVLKLFKRNHGINFNKYYVLQQYLPFTVLKLSFCFPFLPSIRLQQYLPFTVLKLHKVGNGVVVAIPVATVLTVYGIETYICSKFCLLVAVEVATVLTVYGIETYFNIISMLEMLTQLQQYLPFTVLKPSFK